MTYTSPLAWMWRQQALLRLETYLSYQIIRLQFDQTQHTYGNMTYVVSHATLYLIGADITVPAYCVTKMYKNIMYTTTDWYIGER